MASSRDRDVVHAIAQLTDRLVGDYDVADMLVHLAGDFPELLDVAAAGILLADSRGALHLVASSSEQVHHLEVFQLQRDQGPCLECFRSGTAVVAADLRSMRDRWPDFAAAAEAIGVVSVHAVPVRLRHQVLGAVGLFGEEPGQLPPQALGLAQALAHLAAVGLIAGKASADPHLVDEQLRAALRGRVVLEQAKGVLADAGGLDMDGAFALLRGFAEAHDRMLGDVAEALVSRTLSAAEVLGNAGHERPPA